jgi:CRISPR system Cascade subunit CasB
MSFIEYLQSRSKNDTKVKATLRRSLAFAPGKHIQSFPFVEPFVQDKYPWERKAHYLVAGLWAAGKNGEMPFAVACRKLKEETGSESIEARFIALLDSDEEQLPHRLRQMNSLLKNYSIDYQKLLGDLLWWNKSDRSVQARWAKEFYGFQTQPQPGEVQ